MKKLILLMLLICLVWWPKLATFSSAESLVIENLTVASGEIYEVVYGGLQVGELPYTDRTYTFSAIPDSYLGLTYIKGANDDKMSTLEPFLSFEINQDAIVYVCLDGRTLEPAWLSKFVDTGEDLDTTGCTGIMDIYKGEYPAGQVILGGNAAAGGSTIGCMYIVLVEPAEISPPSSVDLTARWQQILPKPENDLEGWTLWYSPDQLNWTQWGTIAFVSEQAEYFYQFTFPENEGVWYFRMRSYDEVPNFSDWSNIASIDLGAVPDIESPANPEGLIIERISQ